VFGESGWFAEVATDASDNLKVMPANQVVAFAERLDQVIPAAMRIPIK
jgi:hypothetical protein